MTGTETRQLLRRAMTNNELVQGKVWRREDAEPWIEQHRPHPDGPDEV
jgi:hypothetical protein